MECEGCVEEIEIAYEYQDRGYYLASYIPSDRKEHFAMIIIDKKGKWVTG